MGLQHSSTVETVKSWCPGSQWRRGLRRTNDVGPEAGLPGGRITWLFHRLRRLERSQIRIYRRAQLNSASLNSVHEAERN